MTQVVFYLLPSASATERQAFVCRLAEKAYRVGHKIHIRTQSDEQSRQLDDLLWTFRAGSFLPHARFEGNDPDALAPILISSLSAPEPWNELVINLAEDCPARAQQCARILEILDKDPQTRDAGRQRYRQYRQQGFDLETHDLAAK